MNQETLLRFIGAFPNPKDGVGGPRNLFYPDTPAGKEEADRFAKHEDVPGRAVYDCVALFRQGVNRRSLETVAAIPLMHADVDLKDIEESKDAVIEKLLALPYPPSLLRDSGHGIHVEYHFKELIEAGAPEAEEVRQLRTRLTRFLCGDPAPDHHAALMRRAGTTNSKDRSSPLPCKVIVANGYTYDPSDLRDLLDEYGDRTLFTRKEMAGGNGHDPVPAGLFATYAAEHKAPLDVEARLAAMQFEGSGETAIHATQLSCTASLLRGGTSVEDATAMVLDATRQCVANDPRAAAWDWEKEEIEIKRMCTDLIRKNPELVDRLPEPARAEFEGAIAKGLTPRLKVYGNTVRVCVYNTVAEAAEASATEVRSSAVPYLSVVSDSTPKARADQGWSFYEDAAPLPLRWLVKQILPESGVGILSGQWGSFKTTAALDLSVAVMTGQSFARQFRVKRPGGVLYFAVEGAGTLQSRLAAIASHRGAPERLPFAWRGDCPLLTDRASGAIMVELINAAAAHIRSAFDMPTVLVWVDTYVAAAGLNENADNDTAATQRAFNTLRYVSNKTGTFVMTVDHYGKVIEAGTRGSSAKEGAADTVMTTLADREVSGAVSNTRMAARKQRDGHSGFEVPFTAEIIDLGADDDDDPVTAVTLEWEQRRQGRPPARKNKNADLLMSLITEVAAKQGFLFQPVPGGKTVQACREGDIRAVFYERLHVEGTTTQRAERRAKHFKRAVETTVAAGLVGITEEQGAENILWRIK